MKKKFKIKVFCGNCHKQSELEFEYGTDLDEKGFGSDFLLFSNKNREMNVKEIKEITYALVR